MPTEVNDERTLDERRKEALAGARESKKAKRTDAHDREVIVERLLKIVAEDRPEVNPEDVEFIFTGDFSDVIIFIPEDGDVKNKRAHRLKPGR